MYSISVFFPCYNDAGTIASMVVITIKTLKDVANDYEVIVIDDGSTDNSREILLELQKVYPKLKLVFHKNNIGYGGALISGFKNATKELVFYTDGDAQYDPSELKILLSKMGKGIDVVNGYKMNRSDPFYRVVIGKAYHCIARFLFKLKVRDVDCDFRLIRRDVFNKIKLESTSGVICVELMKKIQDAGFTITEVPVHHYYRVYIGSQFFTIDRIFKAIEGLIRFWWQIKFSKS